MMDGVHADRTGAVDIRRRVTPKNRSRIVCRGNQVFCEQRSRARPIQDSNTCQSPTSSACEQAAPRYAGYAILMVPCEIARLSSIGDRDLVYGWRCAAKSGVFWNGAKNNFPIWKIEAVAWTSVHAACTSRERKSTLPGLAKSESYCSKRSLA